MIAVLKDSPTLFPLSPIPKPMSSASRSPRFRQRCLSALEIWEVAERIRVALNRAWNTIRPSVGEVVPCGRVRLGPRVWDDRLHGVWSRLLCRAKKLVLARRGLPTGVDPFAELCKSALDSYVTVDSSPYVPFIAADMAETDPDIKPIHMLDALPEHLRSCTPDTMIQHWDIRKDDVKIIK